MARIQVHPMSVGPTAFGEYQVHCAPYPLGCIVAAAMTHREGALREHFDFLPITPAFQGDAVAQVDTLEEPGIFLFSSYVWNHAANLLVAERVKRRQPGAMVVFGGPEIPRRPVPLREFFARHSFIDLAVRGEGEETFTEILEVLARARVSSEGLLGRDFSAISGLTYRGADGLVEAPDRPRAGALAALPSPYTMGLFDHWIDGTSYMALETNRGCPYGCTFCDWGAATLSKIRTLSDARVFGDIEYAGQHRLGSVYVCDANFGILRRDVDIARKVVAVNGASGYPKVISYNAAKTVKTELREIIKLLRDAGLNTYGQISIQTTDTGVLTNIRRSNIKLSEYDKLIEFFRQEKIPGLSELMVGLPGQSLVTCKKDLQFLFDRRAHARMFPTSAMPNAPMADPEYRREFAIETDEQGYVVATSSFGRDDYVRMCELGMAYKLLANLGTGLFKYLLMFLQLDRGLPAVDAVSAWLDTARDRTRYPAAHDVWRVALAWDPAAAGRSTFLVSWGEAEGQRILGNMDALLSEALTLWGERFGIDTGGSDVTAVLAAQRAVMPGPDCRSGSVPLQHDVAAYLDRIRDEAVVSGRPAGVPPLIEFGPGEVIRGESRTSLAYDDFSAPYERLEVRSNLSI